MRFIEKVNNWHPFVVYEYRLFSVMVNLLLEFAFFNVWDSFVDPQGPRDWENLELGFCLGRRGNGVEGPCARLFSKEKRLVLDSRKVGNFVVNSLFFFFLI